MSRAVLESTARCSGAVVACFALEELDLPFEHVIRPDGFFLQNHGTPGPVFRCGDEVAVGFTALLRSLGKQSSARFWPADHGDAIEGWIALALRAARPLFEVARDEITGEARAAALETIEREFAIIDERLARGPYLCGETITAADWPWVALPAAPALSARLPPSYLAYTDRLRARPTWARAQEKRAAPR
ncbi:MAG: glutathione S-transferase family protein [Polyangiaceae bacterium]